MSFSSPLAFLALLLLPLGIAAYVIRQRRPRHDAIRFPAVSTLAAVVGTGSRWQRHVPAALLALALVGLVFAFAKPEHTVAVADQRASVMLVIDGSGSMAATDVEPTRLDAVRSAAKRFLDKVPDDLRVGALAFERVPTATTRPTTDRGAVRDLIDNMIANGGTGTGDALSAAIDAVRPHGSRDRDKPAAIILLSDGRATAGHDPLDQARRARDLHVPIYTVALGTDSGTVPGGAGGALPVPPDPATMRQVADISRGRFYRVEDGNALTAVYSRLGSQIGSHNEQREITVYFAAIGMAALLAALALSVRRTPALP
ncbi:MAG: Ca-activated chloride channel [Thermoleophilaceae bacterium]|jgi:Ca-activated chloride channel family protein|nr:Ca-activated chloride channel [Thermoleophilaceae bacterium]